MGESWVIPITISILLLLRISIASCTLQFIGKKLVYVTKSLSTPKLSIGIKSCLFEILSNALFISIKSTVVSLFSSYFG